MSSFTVIDCIADHSTAGWSTSGNKYHNQTDTSSGVQTFKLGNADGSVLYGHDIEIDFDNSSKYVVTDPLSGTSPETFYVGSTDPTVSFGSSTVDLVNSTDYLYVFYGLSTGWVKLGLNGPVTSGGGTGTESLNTGTVTQNMDGSLSFQVDASSDSSETYSISLDNVNQDYIVPSGVGPWYHNYTYAVHTAIGYGTWRLYDQNGVLDHITTTSSSSGGGTTTPSTTPSTTKKRVFCNFW